MRYVYEDARHTVGQDESHRHQGVRCRRQWSPTSAVRTEIAKLQQDGYGQLPGVRGQDRSTPSPPTPSCARHPRVTRSMCARCGLAAGAEFVVMICGDIMTMPGLPKEPASTRIDIDDDGKIPRSVPRVRPQPASDQGP